MSFSSGQTKLSVKSTSVRIKRVSVEGGSTVTRRFRKFVSETRRTLMASEGHPKCSENYLSFSKDFRRLPKSSEDRPKTSEDFRRIAKSFKNHPNTSEDNRRLSKIQGCHRWTDGFRNLSGGLRTFSEI